LKKNGEMRSLKMDWSPAVISDAEQEAVDYSEFENRFASIVRMKSGESEDENLFQDREITIKINRLVCGYVDLGTKYKADSKMQLGCMAFFENENGSTPYLNLIPLNKNADDQGILTKERLSTIKRYQNDSSLKVNFIHND